MEDKLSLLMKKLHDELDEYRELEQYTSLKRYPKLDERYGFYVRLIALTEDGDMDMDEEVLDALLDIDGVLGYCWDIEWEREIPIEYLYRELMRCYQDGEVW